MGDMTFREWQRVNAREHALDMVVRKGSIEGAIDLALRMRALGLKTGSDTYFVEHHLVLLASRLRVEAGR